MNKNILPILMILLACACKDAVKSADGERTTAKQQEQDTCNWLTFDYKVAKAFLINDPYGYTKAFDNNRPFDKYIKTDTVWILDTAQVNKLNDILCGRMMKNPEEFVAACFDPHHGVLFYDKKNKVVASVNICFSCNNAQISPPAKLHDMQALGQWCDDIGMSR